MNIDARTAKSLEWDRLTLFLAGEASCEPSRRRCIELVPHSDSALVEILLHETAEALSMLSAGFSLAQAELPDIEPLLERLQAAAQLSGAEFGT